MNPSRLSAAAVLSAAALALPALAQADAFATVAPPAERPALLGGDSTAVPPAGGSLADLAFDSRTAAAALAPTTAQKQAVSGIAGGQATWNRSGTPRSLSVPGGALTRPTSGDPLRIATSWLEANRAAFGLSAADMAALAVVRNHELPGVKARVLSFAQTFGGIEAGLGGILTVVVDRDGRVVSYTGDPVRDTTLRGGFDLSAAQALTSVIDGIAPGSGFVARATGKTIGGYQVFGGSTLGPDQLVRKVAFPTLFRSIQQFKG